MLVTTAAVRAVLKKSLGKAKVYSESYQTSKMESFSEIVSGF